jgi:hypothetical protein
MNLHTIIVLVAVFILLLIFIGSAQSSSFAAIAPNDWVREGNIEIYSDRVVIYVDNASISRYEDSNSMVPVLDSGVNGIRIVPEPEDIHIGDIVSYEAGWIDGLIVHRVVYIGEDEEGRYYILKGDNNIREDPEKVRFEQIRYITIALVY